MKKILLVLIILYPFINFAQGRPDHNFDFIYDVDFSEDSDFESYSILSSNAFQFSGAGNMEIRNTFSFSYDDFESNYFPDEIYESRNLTEIRNDNSLHMLDINYAYNKPEIHADNFSVLALSAYKLLNLPNHTIYTGIFYMNTMKSFGLDYAIPLPYISYAYRNDNIFLNLGIPFILFYNITDHIKLTVFTLPVYNTDLSIEYRPLPFIAFAAEYQIKTESYNTDTIEEEENSLYNRFQEVGFRYTMYVSFNAGFYIYGGYRYWSSVYESDSALNTSNMQKLEDSYRIEAAFQIFLYNERN